MDLQERYSLGIGYYYQRLDDSIIYIPIEKGKGGLEKWLKSNDNIKQWVKVEANDEILQM